MHIFFFLFLGPGPPNPYEAGLDPASPARLLAQTSDLAGLSQRHA